MRWLITLLLLVLVAVGGAVLLFPDKVLPAVGLAAPAPEPSPVLAELAKFTPDTVRKITVTQPGQSPLAFEKLNGAWVQAGGMDLRQDEVNELVATACGLRTRYAPLAPDATTDYGLAKPIQIVLEGAPGQSQSLALGRPKPAIGEAEFGQPAFVKVGTATELVRVGPEAFAIIARPAETYLRKQLFADARRARFNEAAAPGQPPLASESRKLMFDDGVKSIEISGPDGKYTLTRFAGTPTARREPGGRSAEPAMLPVELADAWKLTAPTEDRVDPVKLKTILTALPDLWVERFLDPEPLADAFTDFLRISAAPPVVATVLQQSDRAALREYALVKLTGFTKEAIEKQKKDIENGKKVLGLVAFDAERVVTVNPAAPGKQPVTLRIGAVSRVTTRKEQGPPMGMFPGMEREVKTEYRFAKFDGNSRVFEVKADKVADVFVKAEDLADPKIAQFNPDEAASVTITVPGQFAAAAAPFAAISDKPLSTTKLTRVKGKPTATTEKAKKDRWFLGDRLAEASEVTSLLEALSKMEAKATEDRVYAVAAPGIPVTVAVEVEPKVADGDDARPKKAFTFQIAGRDPTKNKLAVRVDGWSRLNWVDLGAAPPPPFPMAPPPPPSGPAADELVLRPVSVYRSKQLFDTADSTLDRVKVTPDSAAFLAGSPAALGGFFGIAPPAVPTGFELQLPTGDGKWALTAPVNISADESASKLATDLSELKTVEEIADAPTDAQLAEFGLAKPRLAVVLGFRGTDARTESVAFGHDVPKKGEVYARRNGAGGVFTVPKTVADLLSGGAESLLPKQPWALVADKITSLGVKRGPTPEDSYTLARGLSDPKAWTLAGPFAVSADAPQAEALVAAIVGLKAAKYEPLTVPDARRTKYGLDQPAARLAVTATDKDDEKKAVAYTLLIGGKVGDTTDRYAKLEGQNSAVFVVSDAVFVAADKSAVAYLDRRLLNLDPTKIAKLQLTGGAADSAVTLVNEGKGWKPEGAAFPVDEPTVFALAGAASRLTAIKLVAYGNAANLAQYGFDKPAHTVTLTVTGEPSPVVIQVGKEEPSGERFVRVDGKPGVGLVSGFVASVLMKGKLDVIDRGLFNFDPLLVTGVTRTMGKDEFELAPAGRGWEVAKPKKFKADTRLVEAIAGETSGLRANKVAAFAPADPKPFGLDAPAAVVTFKVDGKDQVLKIGAPVDAAKPTEDRYAAVAGSQVVAVIPGALASRLLAEPVKFSDRTLNPNRFVDADKVVVTRDGRTATFVKKDGIWKMTAPAEATAETNELEEFIAIAAQLRAEELVANEPPAEKLKELGFNPPQGRIVISNGDKEVLNLLVGNKEKAGPRVHAKLDKGGLVGLLDAATSAKATGEFRSRAVWPAADGAQAETLAFSGNGDFAFRKKDGGTWEDTTPPMGMVDATKVTDAVAVLAGLKAERYVADKDANLALYGLDKAKRVIVLSLKGGEKRVLHLGNPVGGAAGKQVYAKVEDKGRTDVFVLSEADTAKLTGDRKAFGK